MEGERMFFTVLTANGAAYRVYGPGAANDAMVKEMAERVAKCVQGSGNGQVFCSDYRLELVGPAAPDG